MPSSDQFGTPPARQSFALERRGELPRGTTARLPTALTMGGAAGGPPSSGTGGGGGGGGSKMTDAGYTSGNPDVSARTVLLRPVTPQRLANRLRGLSAVRSAVRRVAPRTATLAPRTPAPRTPAPRTPGSRS